MTPELDSALVRDFPLLYADRGRSMRETCMCWGFSCGDGWEPLIRSLSEKLEPIIARIAEENDTGKCYKCGCDYLDHSQRMGMLCKKVHKLPYFLGPRWSSCQITTFKRDLKNAWLGKAWWYGDKIPSRPRRLWQKFWDNMKVDWKWTKHRMQQRIYRPTNRLLNFMFEKFGLHWKKPCHCNAYEVPHPRASQVKEKFGTLSFYMSHGTDEIWDLIGEAERESAATCEDCGEPGKLRGGGWIRTLCDTHAEEAGKEQEYEEWIEERKQAGDQLMQVVSVSLRSDKPPNDR